MHSRNRAYFLWRSSVTISSINISSHIENTPFNYPKLYTNCKSIIVDWIWRDWYVMKSSSDTFIKFAWCFYCTFWISTVERDVLNYVNLGICILERNDKYYYYSLFINDNIVIYILCKILWITLTHRQSLRIE